MDTEKLKAWSSLLEKIAGLVALLCLTAVMMYAIGHIDGKIIANLLQDGRGAAIFSVSLLSAIILIVMLLNANLKTTLLKVLLVLVGALAGLLGQPSLSQYQEDDPNMAAQSVKARTHHHAPPPVRWVTAE